MRKPEKKPISYISPGRANIEYSTKKQIKKIPKKYSVCPDKNYKEGKPTSRIMIEPEGRIIDPKFKWCTPERIQQSIEASDILPENKDFLIRFVKDAGIGKTILKGAKKKVGLLRQIKYVQDLKKLDVHIKKPFDQITQQDLEKFVVMLEDDELLKSNGKPYAIETKVAMKKIIIKFYKWLLAGNKYVPDEVSWIDTHYNIKDYRAISRESVQKIVNSSLSTTPQNLHRNKALIMVLFDSGVRADELLNMRLRNVSKDVRSNNYKLRVEYSKTKPRTISVPLATPFIDEWLKVHPHRDEPLAQLFPMRYQHLCKLVKDAGRRVGLKITPHALRHASATYWASSLSNFQMCSRFGWAMHSKQPSRYIDQEGLEEEVIDRVAENQNNNQLERENKALNERLAMMEERLDLLMRADREELKKIISIVQKSEEGAI